MGKPYSPYLWSSCLFNVLTCLLPAFISSWKFLIKYVCSLIATFCSLPGSSPIPSSTLSTQPQRWQNKLSFLSGCNPEAWLYLTLSLNCKIWQIGRDKVEPDARGAQPLKKERLWPKLTLCNVMGERFLLSQCLDLYHRVSSFWLYTEKYYTKII